jgi:hypothetical protein|tara:strand:+ start:4479 stop:5357 length:879 start_codon:yes stop_codon:yes gene_type:complete
MKKILVTLLIMLTYGMSASAKEKLYILNSGSTGGSFNGQMTAYAEDLSKYYDVEYVQGKGCNKASANIDKITNNGGQVFYIWNGLRTADYYNKKNDLCGKIPSEQNFVNSVLKYGIFFTTQNGIDKNNIFKSGIKVGYNSNTNQRYLQELMNSHGVEWQLVRYENSKGVRLGVVNNEVDFGMINSAASYWKKTKKLKLKALFTLNSNGENDITALADVSDFKGAGNGIADMFLLEGGDNIKLRKIVSKILNDPDSKISLWYSTAKGYTQTVDMDLNEAIEVTENAIENWVKR